MLPCIHITDFFLGGEHITYYISHICRKQSLMKIEFYGLPLVWALFIQSILSQI